MKAETRKAINFDLDTKALKVYYCKTRNPFEVLNAYKEIKKFLESNGFSHRQWSGYVSNEPMTDGQISYIVTEMSKKLYWFPKCVKKCDATEIGEQHDLMAIIQNATNDKSISKAHPPREKTKTLPKQNNANSNKEKDVEQKGTNKSVSNKKMNKPNAEYEDL